MEINEEVVQTWLSNLIEWQECQTNAKFTLDMIKRKAELTNLLSELEKVVSNLEPRQVLSQFPSVPKLLQILLDNAMIQTTENLHKLVLRCVTGLAVSRDSQQEEVTTKSVKWVKSKFKNICTSNPSTIDSVVGIAEYIGVQPVDLTEEINKQLVLSSVKDLTDVPSRAWDKCNREFVPVCPVKGTVLRNICCSCLAIISSPIARPLVEALLTCHVGNDVIIKSSSNTEFTFDVEHALSSCFLENVKENPKEWYTGLAKGTLFSYEARLGLWLNYPTFFENELLDLLEVVCKENVFLSYEEMKNIITVRSLPRALSENISLFSIAFTLLQRVILKTRGDAHIMKLWGCVLDCVNERQRQRKLTGPLYFNYAVTWSARLSNLVSTLNVDWLDLPRGAFLHRTLAVEYLINEICRPECRCESYYIWLILQGFPKLFHKGTWVVLLEADEFVQPCLTILLWYFVGGTKLHMNVLNKMQTFVNNLRISMREEDVSHNDISTALNSVFDVVPQHAWNLIRTIFLVYIAASPCSHSLNIHNILTTLLNDLPLHHATDFILRWFEETRGIQEQVDNQWPYEKLNLTSHLKILCEVYTKFEEFVNNRENHQNMSKNIQLSLDNLRRRYDIMFKLLTDEGRPINI